MIITRGYEAATAAIEEGAFELIVDRRTGSVRRFNNLLKRYRVADDPHDRHRPLRAPAIGHRPGELRPLGRPLPRGGHPVADLRPAGGSEHHSRPPSRRRCGGSIATRRTRSTCSGCTGTTRGTGHPGQVSVPEHIVLPSELTGVDAKIVLVFGNRFPMIGAHKVLAAYSCLVPRVVSGQFDPTRHRAIWPSTGNYARGGIAISRLMQSRGVAVLPENMSQERFDWLDQWVPNPDDVIRTPGSESNVKEIYDACNELEPGPRQLHPQPVQRVRQPHRPLHRHRPGARATCSRHVQAADRPGCGWRRSTSASGSAGTLGPWAITSRTTSAPRSWPSRRSSARRCSTTATASTTSRASATSTSR